MPLRSGQIRLANTAMHRVKKQNEGIFRVSLLMFVRDKSRRFFQLSLTALVIIVRVTYGYGQDFYDFPQFVFFLVSLDNYNVSVTRYSHHMHKFG